MPVHLDGPETVPLKRIKKETPPGRFFCSQHLQKLDLLPGGAGEEPVLQTAEQARHHPLLRREEGVGPGGLYRGGGCVHIVHQKGEVGDAALGHGDGDGGLDPVPA